MVLFFLVGKGSTKVRNQIKARNDSVEKTNNRSWTSTDT